MATEQQKRDAASKMPKERSPHEQGLVDDNPSQAVRNLDHEAKRQQRIFG